jgi:hypothetical protein
MRKEPKKHSYSIIRKKDQLRSQRLAHQLITHPPSVEEVEVEKMIFEIISTLTRKRL